ncbi:MAG: carboxy terminal-processing peptidase [Luminiphilus sp.]|nr:carboxy terminal-processing peptidase [Luminiphilus sp.]MDG1460153.1 carboxy terminal-processing peptidase [Luminiphilus sp.]
MPLTILPRLYWLLLIVLLGANRTWALAPEAIQGETLGEMINALQNRHYEGKSYDDALSAAHLDAYIDTLDPQKMFFTLEDVNSFQVYRTTLDDAGREGNLDPAFTIFTKYQANLTTRLEAILVELPTAVPNFDYGVSEYLTIDGDDIAWAASPSELDDRWRKRLKNQALSLKLADKPMEEIAPTLKKRYSNQLNRLQQYNERDVFAIYANALTELYDPHTSYFSPRRAENFDINMSLSFDGIGAVLQVDDEYTKVVRLVPAGPADKQGELSPSDLIIGVGQGAEGPMEDVVGWRLDEVVDLIRGPRETTVRLEVIPGKGKTDQRQVVAIERNKVKLEEQAAQSELLELEDADGVTRKVGVIEIPAFYIDFAALRRGDDDYKSTTRDVKKLIEGLEEQGAEALVIDLRNNGGGSLQEANDLTGLFIEYGPTVQIRSAERKVWRDGKRRRSDYYQGPVAVLINRLSASASEIFAGAIQDYGRGIVLGDRSFGKGTVQTLLGMPEGQLKVTESKFYRISGDSTQHRGVVPDIDFPSLFDPGEIGESALDNALDWDQISPVRHREYSLFSSLIPTLSERHQSRIKQDPDYTYLVDQVLMATETRGLKSLPLNEEERMALRDSQEQKALEIENKRRLAQGLEPLDSLRAEDESTTEDSADVIVAVDESDDLNAGGAILDDSPNTDDSEDDPTDVLLIEAGRILADTLALTGPSNAAATAQR